MNPVEFRTAIVSHTNSQAHCLDMPVESMKQADHAAVTLGKQGAPILLGPPGSLRDRLVRQLKVPPPWVEVQSLPKVDAFDQDVQPEHHAQMVAELKRRSSAIDKLFNKEFLWLPQSDSQKTPPTSKSAKFWRGGRADDVIVAVPEKSGTTWVQHICHQLRVGGHEPDFDDQMDVMNWLETGYHFYGHDADAEHPHGPPRIIKSHLTFGALPAGTRKIFVYRDICDVIVSMYWFFLPFLGLAGKITISAFLEDYLHKRPNYVDNSILNLAQWWQHRNDRDVLFLLYDELLHGHRCCICRIAAFMDINPGAAHDLIDRVMRQTTHTAMSNTRGPSGKDPFSEHTFADLCSLVLGLTSNDRSTLIGKVRRNGGQTGQGKTVLPAWLVAEAQRAWDTHIKAPYGFRDLAHMQAARAAELRQSPL